MFTGLVEKTAHVSQLQTRDGYQVLRLELAEADVYAQQLGESIAVNGCCLTVTERQAAFLQFEVSHETLAKTNLGQLQAGSTVNLERALRLGDRLGGHMVSGHVDGLGVLEKIEKNPGGWDVYVNLPPDLGRYVIAKGSITLDGVSLTVNSLKDQPQGSQIRLTLIPTTIEMTSFHQLKAGWSLNVEVDLIGKYIERLLPATHEGPR